MRFVVHCLDKSGALPLRLQNYEAHKAYLASGVVRTVVSGPLVADDRETMIGSMFIFEADSKDDVIAFNTADPFNKAGIWGSVSINAFLMRVDNRG
ncbi:YciI family protein [Acidisoma cellulosilytica]|uniref:YciI family protein n=1 Tax=Acidisoma cellulosilyticum TaxID=2802395 RepID=A0A963Z625_9PROT|nr:YciI family protein [Acidisoma cellulosilyticum]MCB8883570.1 YciI family protein [Acidisoma cellulosilyticum]